MPWHVCGVRWNIKSRFFQDRTSVLVPIAIHLLPKNTSMWRFSSGYMQKIPSPQKGVFLSNRWFRDLCFWSLKFLIYYIQIWFFIVKIILWLVSRSVILSISSMKIMILYFKLVTTSKLTSLLSFEINVVG